MKIVKSKNYNLDLQKLKTYAKESNIKYIKDNNYYTVYVYDGIIGIEKQDIKSEKMEIEIFNIK